jgi:RHS repeat-associated protein
MAYMRKPYSAYGEKELKPPQPHEFLSSFSGKEYDGTGLIYFNARYYDPATGRFLSEDRPVTG